MRGIVFDLPHCRELLAAAGLRVTRIVETIAMLSVIEAFPI